MTNHYLMEVRREADGMEFTTYHVIDTSDAQKAKYHFHRTLKEYAFTDTQFGKHCLEGARHSYHTLKRVTGLSDVEYEVLSSYLSDWTIIE